MQLARPEDLDVNAEPITYQEWAAALLACGASIEIDAAKIVREDAERLALLAAKAPGQSTLIIYGCGTIPFDLRPAATLGNGRVHFRL